ncbi:hypothetical protein OG568_04040 [Streptomyces sp. NBC_01450]|uniref:hypothetical protein n=1 Tax=Streptomyces sp. NBC_01450 TaxID=2903871 RepID=UPI002E33741B|nr:hypothetical protein [Streptomyces sp. NBC_01450]
MQHLGDAVGLTRHTTLITGTPTDLAATVRACTGTFDESGLAQHLQMVGEVGCRDPARGRAGPH